MKRSIASRGAFAILVALPLLPVCGIVLNDPPAILFLLGGRSFGAWGRLCGLAFRGLKPAATSVRRYAAELPSAASK